MKKLLVLVLLVSSFSISTQSVPERFGLIVNESKIQPYSNYLFGEPIDYDVSRNPHFNWGGLRRSWHNNQAWDIFVEANTPVYSLIEGQVFSTRFRENRRTVWGHNIVIENADDKIFYTHLDEVLVCPGDTIKQGQLVGYVGKWPGWYRLPDNSLMPSHLHIAIYKHKLNYYLDNNLQIQPIIAKQSLRGILNI